ncbi:MAG TPA: lantibiotic dehydratase [Streptosporangiaceae bacterium]
MSVAAAERHPRYQQDGPVLLRAAVLPLACVPQGPNLDDAAACRRWLCQVWRIPGFAEAVSEASPVLASRIGQIVAGQAVSCKAVRRAAVSAVRYAARAVGRPTPFGLFAGVAAVGVADVAQARWGTEHRPSARADTLWLSGVIDHLEADPALLDLLDVTFSDMAVRRGGRLAIWRGADQVSIRETAAVRAVRDAASAPIAFRVLAGKLNAEFGAAAGECVCAMLTTLVRERFLITCLRAPMTSTNPLSHVVNRLRAVGAHDLPSVAPLLRELESVRGDLAALAGRESASLHNERTRLAHRMRALSPAGRTPVAVDLLLDCHVQIPAGVLEEMAQAAGALMRVGRAGADPAWADYHASFRDRYGIGTLVPVRDVIDPDTGLGYPAGYPGSIQQAPSIPPGERDERLLALAWGAMADQSPEIALTDEVIKSLASRGNEAESPPHIEVAARLHATAPQAIDRGEFTLTIGLARSAGTLTSRFSTLDAGAGLADLYAAVPPVTAGALPVQLSFRPCYPHAENICRVPAYLPDILALGEHWAPSAPTITVDDLAITATAERLYLVSMSRRRIVEPQLIHALALAKQAPPLARFLAELPRATCPVYHEFDWGQHAAQMPFMPRVRYRRSILCPAQWRLTSNDMAPTGENTWRQALRSWQERWHCPDVVELRDEDRALRLDLTGPAHQAVLRNHVARHGHAVLAETATADALGWIGGHSHEIAAAMTAARPRPPGPGVTGLPAIANATFGHLPGGPGSDWLSVKITTHPERMNELITAWLPNLAGHLHGHPDYWFVRYRTAAGPDHLRLRIATAGRYQAATIAAVGAWLEELRTAGVASQAALCTYLPEVGRYGPEAAMRAAEKVFATDSAVVSAALRTLARDRMTPGALAAVNMVAIAEAFLGGRSSAAGWFIGRPLPSVSPPPREITRQVINWAITDAARWSASWLPELAAAWHVRADALATYRAHLPSSLAAEDVLESLLHMHHNRAVGINPQSEQTARRLAKQAFLAWRARQNGSRP